MITIEFILILLGYIIPLYIANATPIIIHGKKPLDFKKKFNGKRIFGKGKSIIGTLAGIIVGATAGIIYFSFISLPLENYFLLAFLLALGAMLGDLTESFVKRQIGIKSGEKWFLFDQLDFIIGGLLLSFLIRFHEWEIIVFLLIATVFIHLFTNDIAYKLKLKKVPW